MKSWNNGLKAIVVAPITSSSRPYPTRVGVRHNKTKGWIVIDQIQTVDRQRIVRILATLVDKEVSAVEMIIKQTYAD